MLARLAKRFGADLYGAAKPWAHVVGFYVVFGTAMTVSVYNHSHEVPAKAEPVPARVNPDAESFRPERDKCAVATHYHLPDPTLPTAQEFERQCRINFQTADRSHI